MVSTWQCQQYGEIWFIESLTYEPACGAKYCQYVVQLMTIGLFKHLAELVFVSSYSLSLLSDPCKQQYYILCIIVFLKTGASLVQHLHQ